MQCCFCIPFMCSFVSTPLTIAFPLYIYKIKLSFMCIDSVLWLQKSRCFWMKIMVVSSKHFLFFFVCCCCYTENYWLYDSFILMSKQFDEKMIYDRHRYWWMSIISETSIEIMFYFIIFDNRNKTFIPSSFIINFHFSSRVGLLTLISWCRSKIFYNYFFFFWQNEKFISI